MEISKKGVKFGKDKETQEDVDIKCICIDTKGNIHFITSAIALRGMSVRFAYIRDLKWCKLKDVGRNLYVSMCAHGGVIIEGDDIREVFPQDHKKRHVVLHKCLDELLGDYISHIGITPSDINFMEFLKWSSEQTQNPTEKEGN